MRVGLQPLDAGHADALRELRTDERVSRWWGPLEDAFPLADEPTAVRYAIVVDDAVAGMVQFTEENDPDYRHAMVDLFVGDEFQNRGVGTEALESVIAVLMNERGHHRVTIDPSTGNPAAIRCYEKAGFRHVGVMEKCERDPWSGGWKDALLMELVRPPA